MNNKHKVYCAIGRTGCGKSSLTRTVANTLGLNILKSYTTREAREEEVENVDNDHIFVTKEDFDKLEDLVAYTKIGDIEYGCTYEQLIDSDFYVIDPKGYMYLESRKLPNLELVPIYIKATSYERKKRYIERNNTTVYDFDRRDNSENEQFELFEKKSKGIFTVNNNDGEFEHAVELLKKIVG